MGRSIYQRFASKVKLNNLSTSGIEISRTKLQRKLRKERFTGCRPRNLVHVYLLLNWTSELGCKLLVISFLVRQDEIGTFWQQVWYLRLTEEIKPSIPKNCSDSEAWSWKLDVLVLRQVHQNSTWKHKVVCRNSQLWPKSYLPTEKRTKTYCKISEKIVYWQR